MTYIRDTATRKMGTDLAADPPRCVTEATALPGGLTTLRQRSRLPGARELLGAGFNRELFFSLAERLASPTPPSLAHSSTLVNPCHAELSP
jgi:hypothetical protein